MRKARHILLVKILIFIVLIGVGYFVFSFIKENTIFDNKQTYDYRIAGKISGAVSTFINESKNPELTHLYDKNGILINIQQNDSSSVRKLLISLTNVICFNNKAYGPYIAREDNYTLNEYDLFLTRDLFNNGLKKHQGYRIEIDSRKMAVSCFPVESEREAILSIK